MANDIKHWGRLALWRNLRRMFDILQVTSRSPLVSANSPTEKVTVKLSASEIAVGQHTLVKRFNVLMQYPTDAALVTEVPTSTAFRSVALRANTDGTVSVIITLFNTAKLPDNFTMTFEIYGYNGKEL